MAGPGRVADDSSGAPSGPIRSRAVAPRRTPPTGQSFDEPVSLIAGALENWTRRTFPGGAASDPAFW
jgi:hypothetical protein